MIVCLTLSLFWSPTLPSLVVDLYSLLFPFDATAAELMCSSVLAAYRLRFQDQSHFYTYNENLHNFNKRAKIWLQNPTWPATQEQEAFLTSPLKMHNATFKLWGGSFFSKAVMALTAQIEISIIACC